MALNRQTFRTRTITAIIFAAIMLAGLLWNPWSFLILFSIIHFGCWWEYLKLTEKIHNTVFHAYTKSGMMVMGYGLMLWFCGPAYHINTYGIKENLSLPVSAAGFGLLLIGIFQKNVIRLKAFGMAVSGLVYISLSWGLMMDLYYYMVLVHDHIPIIIFLTTLFPVLIISCMWINDTMAYIVGSLIGKTPLAKVSPKKTWEGTIGGIALTIIAVGIFAPYLFRYSFIQDSNFKISNYHWFIIAAIAATAGILGDLLESKLKRMAGVKDSGTLMPGHGGFLDRFDSLLLATPFVWLYVYLFMN
jgi:phosphatidate cytidylyltransferase